MNGLSLIPVDPLTRDLLAQILARMFSHVTPAKKTEMLPNDLADSTELLEFPPEDKDDIQRIEINDDTQSPV
ncbi:MAG: hypothetical protein FOGNACKC_02869 [Anaerolineae bacterium]|nr:hypothetical protein [Anaerolineae bacterium]